MKTVKRSVYVEFKAIELEDAMKVAPLMDILKTAADSGGAMSIVISDKIALSALKTLSDFGFRMSDGSYYKEPQEETKVSPQPEAHEDSRMIREGTIVKLGTCRFGGSPLQIVKIIKDHFRVGLKDAKDAVDSRILKIPYDITPETYVKFKNDLDKIGVPCILNK